MFMPWSDALSLDIPSIDGQHRWLVDATNALHDELSKASPEAGTVPDPGVIREIVEGLVDYTMNHFIFEEELFNRLGYPGADTHKEEHDKFTASILNLLQRFEDGEPVTYQTLEILKHWLTHHIMEVDRAYAPYLKARGVI